MAETRNDFWNHAPSDVMYTALTTSVTIGSHASGDTGRNTWISGFSAACTVRLRPQRMPTGTAISVAIRNPVNTVLRLVRIWSK